MNRIDLSCDVGEDYPGQPNRDVEIMPFLSSCHICCGAHSGSLDRIKKTIGYAIKNKVSIGAHPSYPDRENFGRLSMKMDRSQFKKEMFTQISVVKNLCDLNKVDMNHVKPHGALYHDLINDEVLADAFTEVIEEIDGNLLVYLFPGSVTISSCIDKKIPYVLEGFGDRIYDSASALRSRQKNNAVIEDRNEVLAQVDNLLAHKIQLYNKETVPLIVDSICMHSDTANAVANTEAIYHHLQNHEIGIFPPKGHTV